MNKQEVIYNVVNSLLAGLIFSLGALSDGEISGQGIALAITSTLLVACVKFKEYWTGTQKNIKAGLFSFY